VLFALLFILVELGTVFSIYIGLTNSAREAARVGSIYQYAQTTPPATPSYATVDAERAAQMDQALMTTLNPLIKITTASQLGSTRYTYDPATPSSDNYRYGDKVTVTLQYQHQWFFSPFLFSSPSITLQAQSEMRIEPGGR
jgi:Flp pilus assembly protein TadG